MSKKKLTSELRFPEFEKDDKWKKKSFEELFEIGNGKDYKHLEKGDIPVYGSGGYMLSVNDYLYNGESACIGRKGTIDNPMFLTGKFWTVDTLFYTHSFKDCIPKYIFYLFQSINWLKHNEAGGVPSLTKTNIYRIETLIPSKEEQQKIASCLSSLDNLIAVHSQKLEALKAHKKGLMQNLFPQGDEKVPKYRFQEFEKGRKWMKKKLEGLAKRGSGHTPNKKVSKYYNGDIKWVSLADSSKLDKGYIYDTKIQISQKGIENSSAVLHPPGTVILSRDAGVGKSAVMYSEMAVSQHFIVWACDESKLSNWFLYYFLQIMKPVFENIAVGSTIKTIGVPYFKDLSISVPSINEQQKIANCLLAVDNLITAQAGKIEQLQLHKNGLMQGLFPKTEN